MNNSVKIVFGIITCLLSLSFNSHSFEHTPRSFEHIHLPDDLDFYQYQAGHAHVLSPEEEKAFYQELEDGPHILSFRFAQTHWRECQDFVTGNYLNYACARNRGISVILKSFLEDHVFECVGRGLKAQGYPNEYMVREVHLVHAGILGDPRHSPRSLHSENRAIDIKTFRVDIDGHGRANFHVGDLINKPFIDEFRSCWGEALYDYNECPLFNGEAFLTGSIGREDRNHQNHLHTSVPYCVGGSYAGNYFRR